MMEFDSTDNPGRFFFALSRDLKSIALSNIQYFQSGKQSHHAKFHVTFRLLYEYLDIGIEPTYRELAKLVSEYDFSPEIKGNGYRSLLRVVQKCCLHLLQLCRYISSVRDSMLFRKKVYSKELESYVSALGQLRAVLYYALKLTQYCQQGQLFADEDQLNSEIAEALMLEVESLSQEFFFGRCLGFQYCESMQRPLQAVGIIMASLSEGYLESSHMMRVATSVFNSGKYIFDPELRAKQMVKVTRTADIRFCQTFWNFPESPIMQQLPSFVCPVMEVNEILTLGPDAFELPLVDGSDTVVIAPPCAHTGPGHVYTRLISAHLREGQQALLKSVKTKTPTPAKPRVPGLIVHFHGGGFVAQSSKSHEVYLRDWAVSIGCPILSVDYSLAPQAPFPRALEECFYAYAWAVQNCEQLGSTGERIIVVGDSAGGNLAISTALRAASFGIRPPDGAVLVYPCTVVKYTPSPARLLGLMDPLLPVGLMARCLAAYAGINEQEPSASPTLQDLHSKESLEQIRFRSYESTDLDWIIIAQDEEEMNQLRSAAVVTPNSQGSGTENTDNILEDFTDGGDSGRDGTNRGETSHGLSGRDRAGEVRDRSNLHTQESEEEVEIFSQLLAKGSCVFPSEGEVTDSLKDLDRSKKSSNPASEADVLNSIRIGGGKGEKSSGVSLIQSRAKQMMAGAQNMLTSLSSYMPAPPSMVTARSVMSSLASNFDSAVPPHTSKSSPGLASPGATSAESLNASPVSFSDCNLPDIETFVELGDLAHNIQPGTNDQSKFLPGKISTPYQTADPVLSSQKDKPRNVSSATEYSDTKTSSMSPGHNANKGAGGGIDTSTWSGNLQLRGESISPSYTDKRQPAMFDSSSSSGVFETPFSTPLSPPGGASAMIPGAESNLSLSSAFVSDTSPHHQAQGLQKEMLCEGSPPRMNCDEVLSPSSAGIEDEKPQASNDRQFIIEQLVSQVTAISGRSSPERDLVDSARILSGDPFIDSVEASNLHRRGSQTISTAPNTVLTPYEDADESLTASINGKMSAEHLDQTENALIAKDQSTLESSSSVEISSNAQADSQLTSNLCLEAGPTPDSTHSEAVTSARCLQTLDMLSPETPLSLAPPTSTDLQDRQASPALQLSINCSAPESPTSVISPQSQAHQPSSSPQAHQPSSSPQAHQLSSSPQLPIIYKVDTCGDSPASIASLPIESKELLEDALMSEDNEATQENLLDCINRVTGTEDVVMYGDRTDSVGTNPHNNDVNQIEDPKGMREQDLFVSCVSEKQRMSSPPMLCSDSKTTPQSLAGNEQDHEKDRKTRNFPGLGDLDEGVEVFESPQKRCYSPPTTLNIASTSRPGLSQTTTNAAASKPVATAPVVPSAETVHNPPLSKQDLPSESQAASSSPPLHTVQSSPTTQDIHAKATSSDDQQRGLELSETPVVTLTPTESGGQMRVWPVGVGMKNSLRASESTPALSSVLAPSPSSPQAKTKPEDERKGKKSSEDSSKADFPVGLKTGMSPSDFELQNFSSHSPLHLLRRAAVVKNPYMSPLTASDEMLCGLTRVTIVGCHLDPLLDDSVMFAKRLRDLDIPVDLHLVDDLPHGFLNFALLSVEARQAADLCGRKISDMLGDSDKNPSTSI